VVFIKLIVDTAIFPPLALSPNFKYKYLFLLNVLIFIVKIIYNYIYIIFIFPLPRFGNITLDLVRATPHSEPCVKIFSTRPQGFRNMCSPSSLTYLGEMHYVLDSVCNGSVVSIKNILIAMTVINVQCQNEPVRSCTVISVSECFMVHK